MAVYQRGNLPALGVHDYGTQFFVVPRRIQLNDAAAIPQQRRQRMSRGSARELIALSRDDHIWGKKGDLKNKSKKGKSKSWMVLKQQTWSASAAAAANMMIIIIIISIISISIISIIIISISIITIIGASPASSTQKLHCPRPTCRYELWLELIQYLARQPTPAPGWVALTSLKNYERHWGWWSQVWNKNMPETTCHWYASYPGRELDCLPCFIFRQASHGMWKQVLYQIFFEHLGCRDCAWAILWWFTYSGLRGLLLLTWLDSKLNISSYHQLSRNKFQDRTHQVRTWWSTSVGFKVGDPITVSGSSSKVSLGSQQPSGLQKMVDLRS